MKHRSLACSIVAACAAASGVLHAGGGIPGLDGSGALPGVAGFEMLEPKNMGGPWIDFDDLMNDTLTGATRADPHFHDLGTAGDSAAIIEGAAAIEKRWPGDVKTYCVNYYDLMNAMLHRGVGVPDLRITEQIATSPLARKQQAISDDTPRLALMQTMAIRLLLKTAWLAAPTPDTMRATDQCLGYMERRRREILASNDSLRIGALHLDHRDMAAVQVKHRLVFEDRDLVEEQSIWRSEIVEISDTTIILLKEAATQYPACSDTAAALAKRAEILSQGLSEK